MISLIRATISLITLFREKKSKFNLNIVLQIIRKIISNQKVFAKFYYYREYFAFLARNHINKALIKRKKILKAKFAL